MRILMLTDSYYPEVGGSETAIWKLGENLVALGHTVGVAVISKPKASNPSSKLQFWNVSSRIAGYDCKFWGKIRNLRKVIREFKPDILNIHFMLESGYVGVKAARAEGIPTLLTNRGKGLYNKPMNFVESVLYPFWNRGACGADKYIATSQEMVDMAKQKFGIESFAISNGVDTDNFTPAKDGAATRAKHNVKPGQRVIVCARRLVPKNGIEYIVRALPRIREKHDVLLWLASPTIREFDALEKIANELNIRQYITFLGGVNHTDLPYYFAAADLVVQPSIAEARSFACLEAMASGRVVVATNTGGLAELIRHKENGYLIPAFQDGLSYAVTDINKEGVENLANAVTTLLDDEPLRKKIEAGAREFVKTCDWRAIAKETETVYKQTIQEFASRHR